MSYEEYVKEYYRVLEQHDTAALVKLFTPDAIVEHPIFGTLLAADFVKMLFFESKSNKVTLINLFAAIGEPTKIASHCRVAFVAKNDAAYEETPVHIFELTAEGLIKKITVIIDTYLFRKEYSSGKPA